MIDLEKLLTSEVAALLARVEKLEKALREIANDADYYGQRAQMYKRIAKKALAND
jgi:hypothetical protein